MFGRDARSNAPNEANAEKRARRQGRGLGPFSSGHLTIILVTLIIVVAFPFAAFAVAGSNSFITDFTSGAHAKVGTKQDVNTSIHDQTSGVAAKVDAKQNLNTAIHDAASGLAAKVNITGDLNVNSRGAQAVGQVNPGATYSLIVPGNLTVTAVHVDTYAFNGTGGAVQLALSLDNCSTAFRTADSVDPPALGETVLTYGDGFEIPPQQQLCVRNTNPAGLTAAVFAFTKVSP